MAERKKTKKKNAPRKKAPGQATDDFIDKQQGRIKKAVGEVAGSKKLQPVGRALKDNPITRGAGAAVAVAKNKAATLRAKTPAAKAKAKQVAASAKAAALETKRKTVSGLRTANESRVAKSGATNTASTKTKKGFSKSFPAKPATTLSGTANKRRPLKTANQGQPVSTRAANKQRKIDTSRNKPINVNDQARASNERAKVQQAAGRTQAEATAENTRRNTQRRTETNKAFSDATAEDVKRQPPKRGLTNRAVRKVGRAGLKVGGPAAVAGLVDQGIQFGADVADRGFDAAAQDAVVAGGQFVEDLPENAAQFGRDLINRPIRTGLGVGAGVLDTAANAGLTIGDAGQAAFQEGGFTENFRRNQANTRSLRDPFGRALEAVSPTEQPQQPTGQPAAAAAATPPTVPGTDQPLPGATQQRTGLGAAMSNREFIADKAKGFRTGFDVLRDAGTKRTGEIGDLAAYNTATRVARNANQVEKATRNMNIDEAEARSLIEGRSSMNDLRGARANLANKRGNFAVQERLDTVGKEANDMLAKLTELRNDTGVFGGQSDENKQKIKDTQDVAFNQALRGGFNPDSTQSVLAGKIVTNQITPLIDKGFLSRIADAFLSSDVSAANILDDNGNLAINADTIDMMSVGGNEGDTVFMEVPEPGGQSSFTPLLELSDIEDANTRAFFAKMLAGGSGQQSLRNANR